MVLRTVALGLAAVLTGWLLQATAGATAGGGARLIMVEQPGCRYCIEWDQEIAPGYSHSAEGRFAPLKRLQRGDAALTVFRPVIYTPTFLVVKDGRELGRVTGYAGKGFFYEELDVELAKAGFRAGRGSGSVGADTRASSGDTEPGRYTVSRRLPHAAR
jgi:hypothetical protein